MKTSKEEMLFQFCLGRVLKLSRRNLRNMHIHELADAVGMSKPTLSRIENGLTSISVYDLSRCADVLGVNVGYMITMAKDDACSNEAIADFDLKQKLHESQQSYRKVIKEIVE